MKAPRRYPGYGESGYWAAVERYLLYVTMFSLPIQGIALLPGTHVTVTKAAGGVLIASVGLRLLLGRGRRVSHPFVFVAVGLFAAACCLSLVDSADPEVTAGALRTFLAYALTLFAVSQVAVSEKAQRHAPWLFVAAAGVAGALAVLALLGAVTPTVDRVIPAANVRRVCVGVHDANDQALLFLFALCFVFFDGAWRRSRPRTVSVVAATVAILAGLVLTMSRTGWLLAAVLVVVRIFKTRHRFRYLAALLVAGLVAAGLIAALKPAALGSARRRAVGLFQQGDRSVAQRVTHVSLAIDRAKAGGAFGSGLATAMDLRMPFRDPLGDPIPTIVHSVPLILWMETGWVGLCCFGWLWSSVIAAFIMALRGEKDTARRGRIASYAALATVYGVVGLVMPFIYRSAFPILLGCALGVMARPDASGGEQRPT